MTYQVDQSGKIEDTAYIVRLPEVITAIKKADGRLRECFSTLVDAQPRPIRRRVTQTRKKSTTR